MTVVFNSCSGTIFSCSRLKQEIHFKKKQTDRNTTKTKRVHAEQTMYSSTHRHWYEYVLARSRVRYFWKLIVAMFARKASYFISTTHKCEYDSSTLLVTSTTER